MRATLLDDAGEPFQDVPLTMWPPPPRIEMNASSLSFGEVSLSLEDYLEATAPSFPPKAIADFKAEWEKFLEGLPPSSPARARFLPRRVPSHTESMIWVLVSVDEDDRRAFYCRPKRGDA